MSIRSCGVCESKFTPTGNPGSKARMKYCSRNCSQISYRRSSAAWAKQDRQRNPEKYAGFSRAINLKRNYGMSIEQYAEMLEKQNGVCAVCRNPETKSHKAIAGRTYYLAVDHDHDTNETRGLLCNNCNRAIGLLNDDPMVLQAAVDYLIGFKRG